MIFTVKTGFGFLIGFLNLIGLVFTLIALYSVFVIARMPRTSSIYIMAATNLTIDTVQLLLGLLYLAPSIITNIGSFFTVSHGSFLFPGDREGPIVILFGSIFMCCWYYGSVAQMLVAVNRLIVVCFPRYDIFTPKRVLLMMIGLYPLAMALSVTAQYILPCCNFSYNHIVLSYTYDQLEGVFNYSNAYIDLWMNSLSSSTCFACYTVIILYVRRMNSRTSDGLNNAQKAKRRMKEYRYALQFSAISMFYLFSWVFFRIFPQYITSEDSLNWFAVISICVALNCSANALVYLMSNVEVQNVVKANILRRNSIHAVSFGQSQHSQTEKSGERSLPGNRTITDASAISTTTNNNHD